MENKVLLFNNSFKQSGDVCLLASYMYILDFYRKLCDNTIESLSFETLCEEYLSFLKTKQTSVSNSCDSIRDTFEKCFANCLSLHNQRKKNIHCVNSLCQKLYEDYISSLLHCYCISNKINGYKHIEDFDKFLQSYNKAIRSKRIHIKECKYPETDSHIVEAVENINVHLSNNEHNTAMILFGTKSGYHSIAISRYEYGYLYRDPNFVGSQREKVSFDFQFTKDSKIYEYILFELIN